jgi:hypothetical protein
MLWPRVSQGKPVQMSLSHRHIRANVDNGGSTGLGEVEGPAQVSHSGGSGGQAQGREWETLAPSPSHREWEAMAGGDGWRRGLEGPHPASGFSFLSSAPSSPVSSSLRSSPSTTRAIMTRTFSLPPGTLS